MGQKQPSNPPRRPWCRRFPVLGRSARHALARTLPIGLSAPMGASGAYKTFSETFLRAARPSPDVRVGFQLMSGSTPSRHVFDTLPSLKEIDLDVEASRVRDPEPGAAFPCSVDHPGCSKPLERAPELGGISSGEPDKLCRWLRSTLLQQPEELAIVSRQRSEDSGDRREAWLGRVARSLPRAAGDSPHLPLKGADAMDLRSRHLEVAF